MFNKGFLLGLPPSVIILLAPTFFIVIFSIIYILIVLRLKKKDKNVIRYLSYMGLFCIVFVIIFATILFVPIVNAFTPFNFNFESASNFIPFGWLREPSPIKEFVRETIPNIVMFIPLGIFIPVVFKKMRTLSKVSLTLFLCTFSIEVLQYFLGRSSDIDDIITNLLGGLIGYYIFTLFSRKFNNKKWWNKFIGNNHN